MSVRECSSDDGLHEWRFGRSRWTGEPRYECCYCSAAVIAFGDDDDEHYLTDVLGGTVVA